MEIKIEDKEEDYKLFELQNQVLDNQKLLRDKNSNNNINYTIDQKTISFSTWNILEKNAT